MEWTLDDCEGRTTVRMVGDCDLYSAPRFKTAMLRKIEDGVRRLLLDMSGVRYLDSTGVGAIICILQAARKSGGELRFSGVSGSPRRVLEMSSILPLMKLEGSMAREARPAGGYR